MSVAAPVQTPYCFFEVTVSRVRELSPSFVRVTFSGPELRWFADNGSDQRIKIVVPLAGCVIDYLPRTGTSWYADWRALPEDRRNPLRTYTVRAVRAEQAEIDVDVVRHDGGLAASWLIGAGVGATTAVLGPDARHPGPYVGQAWSPPGAGARLLVVGDETAVPAVANICAELPRDAVGEVVLEVPSAADFLDLAVPPRVRLTWVARGSADHGAALVVAVRIAAENVFGPERPADQPAIGEPADADELWEVPEDTPANGLPYAWVAGESGVVRQVRRLLVDDHGLTRRQLAAMGYWRRGLSEPS